MLSFCKHCNHEYIVDKVCNPFVDAVVVDCGLVDDFNVICSRVG